MPRHHLKEVSTMSTTKTRLRHGVGYTRVSDRNGREGESFIAHEEQRKRVKAEAKLRGIKIVAWFEDTDRTGKNDKRPGLQGALEAVEPGGIAECIVVSRMSRFARNVAATEKLLRRIEGRDDNGDFLPGVTEARAQLVAGDVNIDTATPQGKLMRGLMALLAQFELDVIEENWSDAKRNAIERGIKISRVAPPGYAWKINGGGEEERRLVVDEAKRGPVEDVFRAREGGASWKELTGLWLERTGERVGRETLRRMLTNRTYLGEVHYGDLSKADAHEAIITPELFAAVQATMGQKTGRPARSENGAMCSGGVLVCGSCGGPMTTGPTSRGKRRMCCQNAECPQKVAVLEELIDPFVEEAFLAWAKGYEAEGPGPGKSELASAMAAEDEARAEVKAFAKVTSASRNPELFAEELAEREDALAEATAKVEQLRLESGAEATAVTVRESWAKATTEQRRKLLLGSGLRVTVSPAPGMGRVPLAERATVELPTR
jgi:DNA invertase Pin-like site-specific DNA recombinase